MWFLFANFFSKKSGWKNFWGKCSISKQNLKDIGNLNRLICREDIEKLDNKVLPFPNFTPKEFPQKILQSFPGGLVVESTCQCRGRWFDPWSGEIPHAQGHTSPCTATTAWALSGLGAAMTEAQHLQPVLRSKKRPGSSSHSPQLEKAGAQQQNRAATNKEMVFKKERKPYRLLKADDNSSSQTMSGYKVETFKFSFFAFLTNENSLLSKSDKDYTRNI